MEAYIKLQPNKVIYTLEKNKIDRIFNKEIILSCNIISSDITFYNNSSFQKIKFANINIICITPSTGSYDHDYLTYLPTLIGDKDNKITNPKTITGYLYFSQNEFDHLYDLIIRQCKKITLSLEYAFTDECDLLLMAQSPLNKLIPNLNIQTYILGSDGLYYLSDVTQPVSRENLIDLTNSKIPLNYFWEQLGDGNKLPHDEDLRWLTPEDDLIIKKTGHSRKERQIQGFKIFGGHYLQWHLEKSVPGPDDIKLYVF